MKRMRNKMRKRAMTRKALQYMQLLLTISLLMLASSPAVAVEGAIGRPITGMQVTPYAGVIPPDPGFSWQLGYIYYGGSIDASRDVPIGGELAAGLDVDLSLFLATGIYIWDTAVPRWNFASMFTLPYIAVDVDAKAVLGGGSRRVSDSASNLFDIYFAPIIASYHVSELEHWSFALYIYAPTADYEVGSLANPGLNNWTFTPSVGYTKLFSGGTFEFSALAGLQFYTENNATNYQNGEIFNLDVHLMKRFSNHWGIGLVGGWIEQLSDDEAGPIIEALDGFKGRSIGLGPAISYSHKTASGSQLDFNLRWVNEFEVKNRFDGDAVQATLSMNF